MGNEHRLLALLALADHPQAVCDLNRQLPLAQSALSQHLARLRAAGLVICQRDGPRVRYALADGRVRRLLEAVSREYRIGVQSDANCAKQA
ncbi:MAG: metalloregulator ArsR/SmtB family transcription factor [Immundisolibacter sp.]